MFLIMLKYNLNFHFLKLRKVIEIFDFITLKVRKCCKFIIHIWRFFNDYKIFATLCVPCAASQYAVFFFCSFSLAKLKNVIKLTACIHNSLWQNKHNIKSPPIFSKLQGMWDPIMPMVGPRILLPLFLATLSLLKLFVDFVLCACFYARNIQIMPGQRLWALPCPPTQPAPIRNSWLSGWHHCQWIKNVIGAYLNKL